MIPQFSITGAIGGGATEFPWMFRDGGPFWALIGSVTQPVFAGGTLLHTKRAADQALRQAAAQYQETVLTAYQNVADTLHAMLADADGLAAELKAELAAEMAYQETLLNLVQAQATRFGDTAALYQALGGGWWNRPDGPIGVAMAR
jgi:outer membrane protein TolC